MADRQSDFRRFITASPLPRAIVGAIFFLAAVGTVTYWLRRVFGGASLSALLLLSAAGVAAIMLLVAMDPLKFRRQRQLREQETLDRAGERLLTVRNVCTAQSRATLALTRCMFWLYSIFLGMLLIALLWAILEGGEAPGSDELLAFCFVVFLAFVCLRQTAGLRHELSIAEHGLLLRSQGRVLLHEWRNVEDPYWTTAGREHMLHYRCLYSILGHPYPFPPLMTLHFRKLSDEEQQRIAALIRERLEAAAAARPGGTRLNEVLSTTNDQSPLTTDN